MTMQLKTVPAAFIFIGSYLPLSLILLTQDTDKKFYGHPLCTNWYQFTTQCSIPLKAPYFSISFFVLSLLCFLVALITLNCQRPKLKISLKDSKYVPSDLMNYVLPYIVAFMSLDYQDTNKLAGFLIFLIWIFWVTHKSGLIILNPVFSVFGWKLYEIKYSHQGSEVVLNGLTLSNIDLEENVLYKHAKIQDVIIIKAQ